MNKYINTTTHLVLLTLFSFNLLVFANSTIAESKYYTRLTPVISTNHHSDASSWETGVNINNNSETSFNYYWSNTNSGTTFGNVYGRSKIIPIDKGYRTPSEILGINDKNLAVGNITENGIATGFYFDYKNLEFSYLKKLITNDEQGSDYVDSRHYYATSINNDNVIVGAGQIDNGSNFHALLYINPQLTPENLKSLGDTSQNNAYAQDVVTVKNGNNETINYWVVGYSEIDPENQEDLKTEHAFLFDNGKMNDLGILDPIDMPSRAYAINSSKMIVGSRDGDQNGFNSPVLFYNGDIIELDEENIPREGEALDINENGQIVGWYKNEEGESRGFLYENENFFDLNDITVLATAGSNPYWISKASGINDQDQISGLSGDINSRPFILDPVLDNLQKLPSIVSPVTRNSDNSYESVSSFDIVAMGEKWLVTLKNKIILQVYEKFGEHWRYTSELTSIPLNSYLSVEYNNDSILLTSYNNAELYTRIGEEWHFIDIKNLFPEDALPNDEQSKYFQGAINNNSIIIYTTAYAGNNQISPYNGKIWALEKINNNWEYLEKIDRSGSALGLYPSEIIFDQGKIFITGLNTKGTNIIGEFLIKNITNGKPTWEFEKTIAINNKYYGYSYYYKIPYIKTANSLLQFNPNGAVDTGEYRPPRVTINNVGLYQAIISFDTSDDSYIASNIIPIRELVTDFSYENNLIAVATEKGRLKVFKKNVETNYWQQIYMEQITDGVPFSTYINNGIISVPKIEQTNDKNGSIKRYYFCDKEVNNCETTDLDNYEFVTSGNVISSIFQQFEHKVTISNTSNLPSKGYRFEVSFPKELSAQNGQFIDSTNSKDCSIFSTKIYCLFPPLESESSKEITFYLTAGAFPGEYDIEFTLDPLYRNNNVLPLEKTVTAFVVEGNLPNITLSYPKNNENIIILEGDSLSVNYEIINWLGSNTDHKFSWYIDDEHTGVSDTHVPIDLSELENGNYTLTLQLINTNGKLIDPATNSVNFSIETLHPYIDIIAPAKEEIVYLNPKDKPITFEFDIPDRPFPEEGYKIEWWFDDDPKHLILENKNIIEVNNLPIDSYTINAKLLPINDIEMNGKTYTDSAQFEIQKIVDLDLTYEINTEILAQFNKTTLDLHINNSNPEWSADNVTLTTIIPSSLAILTKPEVCTLSEQYLSCTFVEIITDETINIELASTKPYDADENKVELTFELDSSTYNLNKKKYTSLSINNERPMLSIVYPQKNNSNEPLSIDYLNTLNARFELPKWETVALPSKIRWTLNDNTTILDDFESRIINLSNVIDGHNKLLVELIDESESIVIAEDSINFFIVKNIGPNNSPSNDPFLKIHTINSTYIKTNNQVGQFVFSTNVKDENNETNIRWYLYKDKDKNQDTFEEFLIKNQNPISLDHLDEGNYKIVLELRDVDKNVIKREETSFEIIDGTSIIDGENNDPEKVKYASMSPLILFCIIAFCLFRMLNRYQLTSARKLKGSIF